MEKSLDGAITAEKEMLDSCFARVNPQRKNSLQPRSLMPPYLTR
jgi:hypothetical protein